MPYRHSLHDLTTVFDYTINLVWQIICRRSINMKLAIITISYLYMDAADRQWDWCHIRQASYKIYGCWISSPLALFPYCAKYEYVCQSVSLSVPRLYIMIMYTHTHTYTCTYTTLLQAYMYILYSLRIEWEETESIIVAAIFQRKKNMALINMPWPTMETTSKQCSLPKLPRAEEVEYTPHCRSKKEGGHGSERERDYWANNRELI